MSQADYDRGFADGRKFDALCLRSAAARVELTRHHFARILREIADILEPEEAPHGPTT